MVIDNEVWLEACCDSAHCYIPFPSNVRSSFSSVLVQCYGYMYVYMFRSARVEVPSIIRFNQFQALIFSPKKSMVFKKLYCSYIAVTKHCLFTGSVSCKYDIFYILSISSTASHCLRSSKLSHLICYAVLYIYMLSLPSSMHFARVDFLCLVDVAAG